MGSTVSGSLAERGAAGRTQRSDGSAGQVLGAAYVGFVDFDPAPYGSGRSASGQGRSDYRRPSRAVRAQHARARPGERWSTAGGERAGGATGLGHFSGDASQTQRIGFAP